MKYAIGIIGLAGAAVVAWAAFVGSGSDVGMAIVAVLAVVFFSTLPVVLGVRSRRKSRAPSSVGTTEDPIVVRNSPAADPSEKVIQTDVSN